MGELEDKINAVLSDPQQMAEISRLAQSLMGTGPTNAPTETAESSGSAGPVLPDIGSLLGSLGGGGSAAPGTDNQALLAAMLPYLSPHRQEKLRAAMRLGKMAKLAGFALKSHGGL